MTPDYIEIHAAIMAAHYASERDAWLARRDAIARNPDRAPVIDPSANGCEQVALTPFEFIALRSKS